MSDTKDRYVLVVEDSDVDFDIFQSVIDQHPIGKFLRREETGENALRFLQELATGGQPLPSVILMDLNLAGMSGIDVVRQIRSDARLREIPSVIISTSSSPVDINASYQAGANTYLSKPILLSEFERMVDRFVHYWFGAASLPLKSGKSTRI